MVCNTPIHEDGGVIIRSGHEIHTYRLDHNDGELYYIYIYRIYIIFPNLLFIFDYSL